MPGSDGPPVSDWPGGIGGKRRGLTVSGIIDDASRSGAAAKAVGSVPHRWPKHPRWPGSGIAAARLLSGRDPQSFRRRMMRQSSLRRLLLQVVDPSLRGNQRRVGLQRQRKMLHRRLRLPLLVQQVAQIVVGRGLAVHFPQMRERLAEPALIDQHGGDVVAVEGVLGGDLNGQRSWPPPLRPAVPAARRTGRCCCGPTAPWDGFGRPLIKPEHLVRLPKLLFQLSVGQQRGQWSGLASAPPDTAARRRGACPTLRTAGRSRHRARARLALAFRCDGVVFGDRVVFDSFGSNASPIFLKPLLTLDVIGVYHDWLFCRRGQLTRGETGSTAPRPRRCRTPGGTRTLARSSPNPVSRRTSGPRIPSGGRRTGECGTAFAAIWRPRSLIVLDREEAKTDFSVWRAFSGFNSRSRRFATRRATTWEIWEDRCIAESLTPGKPLGTNP